MAGKTTYKGKIKSRAKEVEVEDIEEVERRLSTEDFFSKYKNFIYGGIALLVIGVVGFIFMESQRKAGGDKAASEMFRAVQYFEADSFRVALDGKSGQFDGLLYIEDEYGSTDAGNLARYYIGISYLRLADGSDAQQNLADGIRYLKAYDKGDNLLGVAAYMALGFAHEDLDPSEPGEAATYFEKAAAMVAANDQTTPDMLFHAARNYEAAGDPGRALKLYKRIKTEFPASSMAATIDKYIGRVSQ
jgi:hypothetical protein